MRKVRTETITTATSFTVAQKSKYFHLKNSLRFQLRPKTYKIGFQQKTFLSYKSITYNLRLLFLRRKESQKLRL